MKNPTDTPPADESRTQFLGKAGAWALCIGAAWLHIIVLAGTVFPDGTIYWGLPLMLAAPGLVTMAVTRSWKRWYRWAAVMGLTLTTYTDMMPAVFIVAQSWALHRSWVVERTVPLRDLLTFAKPGDQKSVPATAKPKAPKAPKKPKAAKAPKAIETPEDSKAAPAETAGPEQAAA